MSSLVGINGSGLPVNVDNLNQFTRRLDSSYTLSLNEPKVQPSLTGKLIYRKKTAGTDDDHVLLTDDQEAMRRNAYEFVGSRNLEAPVGAVISATNEPFLGRPDLLNAWTMYFVDACRGVGRIGAILNIAVGNDISPLLYPCIRYNHKYGGFLGHHDYIDETKDLSYSWQWLCGRWLPAQAATGCRVVATEFGLLAGWEGRASQQRYAEITKAYIDRFHIPFCTFSWGYWVR